MRERIWGLARADPLRTALLRTHPGHGHSQLGQSRMREKGMHLPDGRTLAQLVAQEEQMADAVGAKRNRRKARNQHDEKRHKNHLSNWPVESVADPSTVSLETHTTSGVPFDPELAAAQQLGARRSRRLLNERFLRELAGSLDASLTAESMRQLFCPPPFGERSRSMFEQVREPGNAPALHAFRHGYECNDTLHPQQAPRARDEMKQCWLRVRRPARDALRRLTDDAAIVEDKLLAYVRGEPVLSKHPVGGEITIRLGGSVCDGHSSADTAKASTDSKGTQVQEKTKTTGVEQVKDGLLLDAWSPMRRLVVIGLCDWYGIKEPTKEPRTMRVRAEFKNVKAPSERCTEYVRHITRHG